MSLSFTELVCVLVIVYLLGFLKHLRPPFDLLLDFLFSLYYGPRRKYVPEPEDGLVLESATSLARKVRQREVGSEEVVRAFVGRIREVNRVINALVDERFEEALEEARGVDRDIREGRADFDRKPFLGVPFTTKESTNCRGMKSSFGLLCRKEKVAEEDADVIRLMKEAGAILLGVTNIPILNMWMESGNPVYGVTNNPYDTTRNAGGSSGGEGSLIASCGSPVGIGTDIGGSIRIPAFMCGIFGHKPTSDLISTKGLTYRKGDEGRSMIVPGPMSKHAEDLIPVLKVLVGTNAGKLRLDEDVNMRKVKVYFITECGDPLTRPVSNEMKTVFKRVVGHFERILETAPIKMDQPLVRHAMKLWLYWLAQEKGDFYQSLTDRTGRVRRFREMVKYVFGYSDFTAAVMVMFLLDIFFPSKNDSWAKSVTDQLGRDLTEKLGTNGVLLYTSAPSPAGRHHTPLFRVWDLSYFNLFSALRMPVTQVPLGLSAEGLPVGIQVAAAPHQDRLCLAVARELERAFGGHVPPFKVDA